MLHVLYELCIYSAWYTCTLTDFIIYIHIYKGGVLCILQLRGEGERERERERERVRVRSMVECHPQHNVASRHFKGHILFLCWLWLWWGGLANSDGSICCQWELAAAKRNSAFQCA